MMPPSESRKLIREKGRAALSSRPAVVKPYVVKPPLVVEINMGKTVDAEIWSWMPGFSRHGNTIRYAAQDMVEAARIFGVHAQRQPVRRVLYGRIE